MPAGVYPLRLKKAMVKKYIDSEDRIGNFSMNNGIPESCLRDWIRESETGILESMDKPKHVKYWKQEEKFSALLKFKELKTETERGLYLRKHGIKLAYIEKWEDEIKNTLSKPKTSKEEKRILKTKGLLHNRSNKRKGKKVKTHPEVIATGPDQVWSWDITRLPTDVKGIYKYLYSIIDIWDKKIVNWEIHNTEDSRYSETLFRRTLINQGFPEVHIHSDNGSPMKGVSLLSLLYDLGCKNSFFRPRVSNDNAFIESFFGTLKTSVKYPGYFKSISDARIWAADFINWYNGSHRHSGINYFTPQQMRDGSYKKLVVKRNLTMQKAYNKNPARWSNKLKQWSTKHIVYLNPSMETRKRIKNAA